MGDNGEPKEEVKEEVKQEAKTPEQLKQESEEANKPKVVMQVIMHPSGGFEMKTSLIPPMQIWILENIKHQILTKNAQPEPKIIQPPGGVINFARKVFRK